MTNKTMKKGFLFFTVLFTSLLHLPTALSSSAKAKKTVWNYSSTAGKHVTSGLALYSKLNLQAKGLSEDAFNLGIKGYTKLRDLGRIPKDQVLTIVDFSKPSTEKRLFVIDVNEEKVLFHTYVAHGKNTGDKVARKFSNIPESLQSSLGFYTTLSTYNGKHGYSLKLEGLERGINHLAKDRAIVIHGADYATEGFIKRNGYLGRSWGCPALPPNLNKPIIDEIKDGSCLFIYSDNGNYKRKSLLLS